MAPSHANDSSHEKQQLMKSALLGSRWQRENSGNYYAYQNC
jgi:hypothetical protein